MDNASALPQEEIAPASVAGTKRMAVGLAVVLVVAVVGVYLVKWSPYYYKAFAAAAHHTLGASIVSGNSAAPPAAGWAAAWGYAKAYYLAIWQALLVAFLLGATMQVFLPRRWVYALLGSTGIRSTIVAGAISTTGMMCTCCVSPLVVSLRRQNASLSAALAFMIGNPILNPAVLVFITFVLSWQFALLRLAVGVALVLGLGWYVDRTFAGVETRAATHLELAPIEQADAGIGSLLGAWFKALWWEIYAILPGYVAIVLILGAARAFIFQPGLTLQGGGILAIVALAIVGTLFVIPTAGEVAILQTLMKFGLGNGPAAALLITLPAISLPSIFIVRSAFPAKVLFVAAVAVCIAGIVAGLIAGV